MHLVLIETSGNQNYIFATNKLRENVGASELTYRVGTKTVLEAVEKITKNKIYEDDIVNLRRNLLDADMNPPLGKDGNKVEVIVATSGKAILLLDDAENKTLCKQIIRDVTQTALREMPGLTVHGAISESFTDLKDVHERIGEVHRKLELVRYELPGNEQRFLRLPFAAPCHTSGLPAQTFDQEGTTKILVSNLSKTKRNYSDKGRSRLETVIQSVEGNVQLIKDLNSLEQKFKELNWIAVIHADGNGLGEIFLNFDKHSGLKDGRCTPRQHIEKYRRFSLALDVCTINAAASALKTLQDRWHQENPKIKTIEVPVVPLVLGGDDLTVLCDGQYALRFTQEFLKNFEAETGKDYLKNDGEEYGIVPQTAFNAFGVYKLGICAGVAIVKPHFPFHQGYKLAESLLRSAKQVKEKIKRLHKKEDVSHPCSALDYHLLYDSTVSRLEDIRDRMKSDNKETWLFARPYVVSDFSDETLKNEIIKPEWCRKRRWCELEKRVAAMMARDDDNKRKLPNSQLHSLREALYLGHSETNARTRLINHRYDDEGFDKLLWDTKAETMFFGEKHNNTEGRATHFIDALDIVEFRKGEKEKGGRLVDK